MEHAKTPATPEVVLTGIQAVKAVLNHASGPQWLGPVTWSVMQAMGRNAAFEDGDARTLMVSGRSGTSLLQQTGGARLSSLGAEILGQLPSRSEYLGTSISDTWLSAALSGQRFSGAAADLVGLSNSPSQEVSEYPGWSEHDITAALSLRLSEPGQTALLWTDRAWSKPVSDELQVWAEIRGALAIEDRTLWIFKTRGAREQKILATDRSLAQRLNSGALPTPIACAADPMSAVSNCAQIPPSSAMGASDMLRSLPSKSRSRLSAAAERPQAGNLRQGATVQVYHGRWHDVTVQELREIQAQELLGDELKKAFHHPGLREGMTSLFRAHTEQFGHPARPASPLRRIAAARASNLLAIPDGEEPSWEENLSSDPVERLEQRHLQIRREHASEVGLDSDTLEQLLLGQDWCLDQNGWVRPEVYYNAYASDLIAQLTTPQNDLQLAAIKRQQAHLEELLNQAREQAVEITPFEPYVPLSSVEAYINDQAAQFFSTMRVAGDLKVDRKNGVLQVELKGRSTDGRRKVASFFNRYLSQQGRLVNEERTYRRMNREFAPYCQANGLMEAITEGRLTQVWAGREWPSRPISRRLPGWKRTRVARPWQERSALRTSVQRRGIIGFRTGVGKTGAGIMHALDRVREGLRAVIVVPSSVLPQWRQEIEVSTRAEVAIIGSQKDEQGQWHDVQSGIEIDYQLQDALRHNRRLLLISASAFERITPSLPLRQRLLKELAGIEAYGWKLEELYETKKEKGRIATIRRPGINQAEWDLYCELTVIAQIEAGVTTPRGSKITAANVEDELSANREEQQRLNQLVAGALPNHFPNERARLQKLNQEKAILEFMRRGLRLANREFSLKTTWDELQVGALIVDECHNYKAHDSYSGGSVRYLGVTQVATRSVDMYFKARTVQRRMCGATGDSTIGLSATPYKNSILDIYNLITIFAPEVWERSGMTNRMFVERYCDILHTNERSRRERLVNGQMVSVMESVHILQRFKNVRELRQVVMPFIDVVRPVDVNLKVPDSRMVYRVYPATKVAAEVIRTVALEPDQALIRWGGNHDLAKITNDAERIREALMVGQALIRISQRAELDLEMIDPVAYKGDVSPKVAGMLEEIASLVVQGVKTLVFCDSVNMFNPLDPESPNPNGYTFHQKLRRLIAQRTGLSESQIGIINGIETPKPEQRHRVASMLNSGQMMVVIGNGDTMGESLNLQEEVGAIQHLDLPDNPAGLEQRQGRVIRQGNDLEWVSETCHMGSRGQDVWSMDLMRGKRGLYDQVWSGSEDVVDNPDRAMIPTSAQLELLAIDDDDLRQERGRELVEIELNKARIQSRRQLAEAVWTIQKAELLRAEIKAIEEQTGKKAPGAKSLSLKRRDQAASGAEDGLRHQGGEHLIAQARTRGNELAPLLPHQFTLAQVGHLAWVTVDSLDTSFTINLEVSQESDEEQPVNLHSPQEQRRAEHLQQSLKRWKLARVEQLVPKYDDIYAQHFKALLLGGELRGDQARVDVYELANEKEALPLAGARLAACFEAGVTAQEASEDHLLTDLELTPAARLQALKEAALICEFQVIEGGEHPRIASSADCDWGNVPCEWPEDPEERKKVEALSTQLPYAAAWQNLK